LGKGRLLLSTNRLLPVASYIQNTLIIIQLEGSAMKRKNKKIIIQGRLDNSSTPIWIAQENQAIEKTPSAARGRDDIGKVIPAKIQQNKDFDRTNGERSEAPCANLQPNTNDVKNRSDQRLRIYEVAASVFTVIVALAGILLSLYSAKVSNDTAVLSQKLELQKYRGERVVELQNTLFKYQGDLLSSVETSIKDVSENKGADQLTTKPWLNFDRTKGLLNVNSAWQFVQAAKQLGPKKLYEDREKLEAVKRLDVKDFWRATNECYDSSNLDKSLAIRNGLQPNFEYAAIRRIQQLKFNKDDAIDRFDSERIVLLGLCFGVQPDRLDLKRLLTVTDDEFEWKGNELPLILAGAPSVRSAFALASQDPFKASPDIKLELFVKTLKDQNRSYDRLVVITWLMATMSASQPLNANGDPSTLNKIANLLKLEIHDQRNAADRFINEPVNPAGWRLIVEYFRAHNDVYGHLAAFDLKAVNTGVSERRENPSSRPN
jgi:hypothetical protein